MLKKIVLVVAVAVASFVSVNVAAHRSPAPTTAVTYPWGCDPILGGPGCAVPN
jgi:hypothetical protein